MYTKSKIKLQDHTIGGFLDMFCQDSSGYTVCDECKKMLENDMAFGSKYNIEKYISSIPSGQVDTYAAGKVAGTVWQDLNGSWPSTVQLGGGSESGTLKFGNDQKKPGFIGFIKNLFGSKKQESKSNEPISINEACDKLMRKHLKAEGVLASVARTADALMKHHGVAPDDAQTAIENWLQENKP